STQGGYLVGLQTLANEIIAYRQKAGIVRQNARVFEMTSDTLLVPVQGAGVRPTFISENLSVTDTAGAFRQYLLTEPKAMWAIPISTELEDDAASSLLAWAGAEFGQEFGYFEDDCAVNGDGTSSYAGIYGLKKRFEDGVGTYKGAVDAATGHDTF